MPRYTTASFALEMRRPIPKNEEFTSWSTFAHIAMSVSTSAPTSSIDVSGSASASTSRR